MDSSLILTDDILYRILSLVKREDLLHARLVSKAWHRNTPTCFRINLEESSFARKTAPGQPFRPHMFLNWILESLELSKTRLTEADKRILIVKHFYNGNICYDTMKLVDEYDFHEVYWSFPCVFYHRFALNRLPYIFQSKCLTVLHLSWCAIDEQLFCDVGNISSLQDLHLLEVAISEKTLSIFLSKCYNINELRLKRCKGLGLIKLPKLYRLKKLYVKQTDTDDIDISRIEIDAPNLEILHIYCKVAVEFVEIHACTMLKELHLVVLKFPDGLPEDLCSNFPRLQTLLLGPCETLKTVKISSPSLGNLIFYSTTRIQTLEISAPNLCYCRCTFGQCEPFFDQVHHSESLQTIQLSYLQTINVDWLLKLNKKLKSICNNAAFSFCVHKEQRDFEPATTHLQHRIKPKHLELDINNNYRYWTASYESMIICILDHILLLTPYLETLTVSTSAFATALQQVIRMDLENRISKEKRRLRSTWCSKGLEVKEVISDTKDRKKFDYIFSW